MGGFDLLKFLADLRPESICNYQKYKHVCEFYSATTLENLLSACNVTNFTEHELNKLYLRGSQNNSELESIKIAKVLERFRSSQGYKQLKKTKNNQDMRGRTYRHNKKNRARKFI